MKNCVALYVATFILSLGAVELGWAADPNFTYTTIDFPGAVNTLLGGINNSGQIVGGYQLSDGTRHGFLYSGGIFATLDDPNATSGSEATGINNSGQIIGAYNLNPPEEGHILEGAHGFLYNGSTFTTIDFPAASNTTPHKINDSDEMVGVYRLADGIAHGFTDIEGIISQLDFPGAFSTQDNGVNNAGLIVGRYRIVDGAPKQGFLDSGGTFTTIDVPGAKQTIASDINTSGDIVGVYKPGGAGGTLGFLNQGSNFFTIVFPGSTDTEAYGTNDHGDIVGAYTDAAGGVHGFKASLPQTIQVAVDIKPQGCPNPFNAGAQGDLPVAILGTATFDVTKVDPSSVKLQGVSPLRSALEDVATPFTGPLVSSTSCTSAGPDGFTDLVLHFSDPAVSAALGTVTSGQVLVLTLTGNLLPQFGGTAITGQDVVVIVP